MTRRTNRVAWLLAAATSLVGACSRSATSDNTGPLETYDAINLSTPEDALGAYVEAVETGDFITSILVLHPDAQDALIASAARLNVTDLVRGRAVLGATETMLSYWASGEAFFSGLEINAAASLPFSGLQFGESSAVSESELVSFADRRSGDSPKEAIEAAIKIFEASDWFGLVNSMHQVAQQQLYGLVFSA